MAKNEVKWGALLSYALIVINACYGFLVTPYVMSALGEADFGVYKTITSLSSSLMILDLGLGGTVMRYIAKYKAENKKDKINSFVSMALGEGSIIILLLAIVSVVIYFGIPTIYKTGLSVNEIGLARKLFAILAVSMVFHIVENVFNGIISGHNRFTFANGLKLVRILVRIASIFVVFLFVKSAVVLVVIDLVLTLALLLTEYVYVRKYLGVNPKISFKKWEKEVFRESFKYTLLLFLTTIAAQINNNLDNVVIGAIKGASFVTIYSMGLLIFGMFEQLSTSISAVMLPTVTSILNKENGNTLVQKTIIQTGRIQFMLLGGALTGFTIIGRDFIKLWLGEGFEDVYIITLILMAPALLELCVNVCLSVLRAKNMLTFRTVVLTSVTVLNAIVTIVGVKMWGYFAAAIGTALSFVIGSVVIMNIYYYKKLSFRMIKIYLGIFKGTWLCLVLAGVALALVSPHTPISWFGFILDVGVFGVVYVVTLLLFGLNKEEKKMIPFVKRIVK